MVAFVLVILGIFAPELTAKVPVFMLLLVTVLKIDVPVICKLVDVIFVARTLDTSKFVVVCVVLFTSGTFKLVLILILPVLRLLLLIVPNIDTPVTLRFDIVEVLTD